ncbi:alpha/beta hydrolase [Streptomyces sp. NPDC048659]|uniref:alpha/beta hydrolase family protein n=1 Tax=Streptomyces sp. NPDC048659 TaxID=3155489 RepID=UPI003431E5EF
MLTPTRAAAAALLACALALPATVPSAAAAAPAGPAASAASVRASAPALAGPAASIRAWAPVPAGPAALAAPNAAVRASAPAPLELPAPTGPERVGSTVLHLVDRSRPDPWVPTADGRELMVTLHYPAARRSHGAPAPYATEAETRLLLGGLGVQDPAGAPALAAMPTHSETGVRPAPGRHPLVVLSPGFSAPRYTLTHLAEDLASRGYVVASVDHAYESLGTAVPDGRILTCVACKALDEDGVPPSTVTAARAADTRFLLDRLTGPRPAWRYAAAIDRTRIGMAGHSIGGASAATAMLADRRVDAGVNMDGAFWDTLPAGGLGGRPFLLLGTDDAVHLPGGQDATWDATWPLLGGWKRWLTVAGTDHFSFSDGPLLQRRFGLPTGGIEAERAMALTRVYVGAFFDRHLRGRSEPLLAGPSPLHPEVKFQRP